MTKLTDIVRFLLFLAFALPSAYIDARTLRIPDLLTVGGIVALLLFEFILPGAYLISRIAGCCFGFLLFFLLRKTTGGMGFGDVKYAGFIGMFTGLRLFFVVLLCSSFLALVYVMVSARSIKRNLSQKIPFAPFLAIGGICAALWGWGLLA